MPRQMQRTEVLAGVHYLSGGAHGQGVWVQECLEPLDVEVHLPSCAAVQGVRDETLYKQVSVAATHRYVGATVAQRNIARALM